MTGTFEDFYGLIILVWWMCAGIAVAHGWSE